MTIYVEFNCPYCGTELKVVAQELDPKTLIKCHCGKIIPAGVFYDQPTVSE